MDSTINLLSYNSTGLDTDKIIFINDVSSTLQIDLLQLQEHFKATQSVGKFFRTHFTNYDNYVTPAVRPAIDCAGRPKGGLCQFVHKKCGFKKERIKSNSWRVQAQILHVNEYKLLWLNVYFPTDSQLQNFDETETKLWKLFMKWKILWKTIYSMTLLLAET